MAKRTHTVVSVFRTAIAVLVALLTFLSNVAAFRSTTVAHSARPRYPSLVPSCPPLSATRLTSVGISSNAGSDPNRPQKVNQDAYFVEEFLGYTCLGVMDGHGLKGHVLTEYLAEQLPLRIQEQLQKEVLIADTNISDREDPRGIDDDVQVFERQLKTLANFEIPLTDDGDSSQIRSALVRAFHQAHVDAMNNPDIPAGRSGTTCIVCLRDDETNNIHVAYVGDSRAVLLENADSVVEALTRETTIKAMAESELVRIEQGEGRVDDNGNVFYGPQGIAMTRSLGNAVMLRAGVVPTPLINSIVLPQNGRIVLATDGIWDVLSNEEVAELVGQIEDVQDAAKKLAQEARRKWIGNLSFIDETKIDDITCLIASW